MGPKTENIRDALAEMTRRAKITGKLVSWNDAVFIREGLRALGATVVFTNGCFDLIHLGHVIYLRKARFLGDVLILGLNSDGSVRRLKGKERPVVPVQDRAGVLAGLEAVDYICIFEEDTSLELIRSLLPDILIKGGDYALEEIVGRKEVEAAGGRVAAIPMVGGQSTSLIIGRIHRLREEVK